MNAAVQPSEFFAPASTDLVDGLIGQYRQERRRIQEVDAFLRGDGFHAAIGYYIAGNREELSGLRFTPATEKLFRLDGAIAALNASYWDRALRMTDVLDCMPAKRREDWFKQIEALKAPDFDEETVRATLGELLAMRMQFLAEKVDGIFRALSRDHVTNRPEGFSKRVILTGVTNDFGGYGRSMTGHVNDLRTVVAKFMGRDDPPWSASNRLVEMCRSRHRGEWVEVDGGAMRIRCYLNGNAHLEVHPDMAWRLNQVLAHLHPAAIPSEFRTAPKRAPKAKDVTLMDRPLPFAVLEILVSMRPVITRVVQGRNGQEIAPLTSNPHSLQFDFGDRDKHVLAEATRVLTAIGGVWMGKGDVSWCEFDYPPRQALDLIIASGRIPDAKSYQFYPTPPALAERAVEAAEIGPDHLCLEPSAGTGMLASMLPADRTTCVEVSELHCRVLEAKGFAVECANFLAWSAWPASQFDRIVMNPPFDQGRWRAHLHCALDRLAPGGRMVAILPEGARSRADLAGFSAVWHGPFANEFPGTSVSVSMLVATRGRSGEG